MLSNATNDFTGHVVIQRGLLVATASGALGAAAGSTMITAGGTLGLRGGVNYDAAEPVTLAGGTLAAISGNNTFAGAITLAADSTIHVAGASLELTTGIRGAGTLTKAGSGTLDLPHVRTAALHVGAGAVRTAAGAGDAGASTVGLLSIDAGAQLDLADNRLVTATALGVATRGTYDGISGLIQSGFVSGQGDWSGSGIVTSMPDAINGGLKTLAAATAGDVLPFESDTILWGGQTVSMSDTIVVYTHTGDANLDGAVDGGDYAFIDAYVGWADAA